MSRGLFEAKVKSDSYKSENITFEQQIERLGIYLKSEKIGRRGKVKALTDQSVRTKMDDVKACIKYAGPCDYTQDWINRVNTALKEHNRSAQTKIAYAYAIQDFYNANGHPGFLFAFPDREDKEAPYHTTAEIERLFKNAGCARDTAILTVLYYGALRNKELRYLYISDVDLKARIIHVKDHGQGIKGKKERDVPIPPKAIPAVIEWLKERPLLYQTLLKKNPALQDVPYMFVSQNWDLLTLGGLTGIINRIGGRAGIETYPHMLRHSRCSYLVNSKKIPVTQVQKIMGHKFLETTQRYSHADINMIAANIDSIDD